jgi:hypothetical protein
MQQPPSKTMKPPQPNGSGNFLSTIPEMAKKTIIILGGASRTGKPPGVHGSSHSPAYGFPLAKLPAGRPAAAFRPPHIDSRFIAKRLFPGLGPKKSDQSTYQKNSLHNFNNNEYKQYIRCIWSAPK